MYLKDYFKAFLNQKMILVSQYFLVFININLNKIIELKKLNN